MASFLDTTPKFAPYIQTTPYEAMAKVGMLKQQQYDQGVQKIQGYIDQIAGLDIYKPEDQEYLKSVLTSVGEKVKGFAGADFSEQQIVDSVGGQIKRIAKDPTVQTAVYSTQAIRKGDKEMEDERVAGKGAVENETYWSKLKQAYLNDGKAGTYFGQKYFHYRDINAQLKKIAAEVGVDSYTIQNMFNPNGTLNKVMVEKMLEGKSANKLYNAFKTGLTPDDYKQLGITGQYKLSSMGKEDLVKYYTDNNNDFIKTANSRVLDIQEEIAEKEKEKLKLKNPDQIKAATEEINKLSASLIDTQNSITDAQTSYSENVLNIQSGDSNLLDNVRSKIYTNSFLNEMSKSFSTEKSYTKYMENPLWKANMEEAKFAEEKWKNRADLAYKYASLEQQKEANKLKKIELGIETMPFTGALKGEQQDAETEITKNYEKANTERSALYREMGTMSLKQAGLDPIAESNKNATIYNTTPTKWLEEYGRNQYTKLSRNGGQNVLPEYQDAFVKIGQYNKEIARTYATMRNIEQQAQQQSGGKIDYKKIDAKLKPTSFSFQNPETGFPKTVVLSPTNIVEAVRYKNLRSTLFKSSEEEQEMQYLENKLNNTFGAGAAAALSQVSSRGGSTINGVFVPSGESSAFQIADESLKSMGYKQYRNTKRDLYNQAFRDFFPRREAMSMKGTAKDISITKLTNVFADRPEAIAELKTALEGKDAQIFVEAVPNMIGIGETQARVFVIGEKGAITKSYDVGKDGYEYLTGKSLPQIDQNLYSLKTFISSTKDRSTNSSGVGTYETAYYSKDNFPNIKKYNVVGGDLVQDKVNPDNYFFHLYINRNGKVEDIPIPNMPLSLDKAQGYPMSFTDAKIDYILNN